MADPAARRVAAALAAVGAVAVVVVVALAFDADRPTPRTPEEQAAAAREVAGHVAVSIAVEEAALGVTRASGDFGIEEGVRSVPVRIVEDVSLRIRIATDRDVVLAEAPRVCLVGPFWNPLDAGLSDRCWGDPDLAKWIRLKLEPEADGRIVLSPTEPFELAVAIARGEERCDYAPGEWRLQVDGRVVVDGLAQERVDLADIPFEVPLEAPGTPLVFRPNPDTRPCSYTAAVFTRQGEPVVIEE